ncbi:hypothetical protein ACN27F_01105 [Solwaraspora sp. WMMB335]
MSTLRVGWLWEGVGMVVKVLGWSVLLFVAVGWAGVWVRRRRGR